MKYKNLLFWAGLTVSVLGFSELQGIHIRQLFHPLSLMYVLTPIAIFLATQYGLRGSLNFVKHVFKGTLDDHDYEMVYKISTLGFLLGTLGCLLGFIHVLTNLTDAAVMGKGVAVSFMTFFYGLLPTLFAFPLVRNNRAAETPRLQLVAKTSKAVGLYCFLGLLLISAQYLTVIHALFKVQ